MMAVIRSIEKNNALMGVLCVLAATVGLSLKAIFIKLVYLADPTMDAISILAIRFLLAVPFFFLLLWYASRDGSKAVLNRRHIIQFLMLGMVGFYLSALLDFSALKYIDAGLERLILFLYPTFVVIITAFVRPTEVNRMTFLALVVSYLGVLIVFIDQAPALDSVKYTGALLVLGAAIVFAFYTVGSVGPIHEHGSIRFTAYAMFAASFATLSHALASHGVAVLEKSIGVYVLILPMAIFSTVLPLILMAEGVKRIGASNTSIIATSGPVITVTMAFFILGETMGIVQAIGGIMIVSGVFLVARSPKLSRVK